MITQKDIHNIIVDHADASQKAYFSMLCGNDVEIIKKEERIIADLINIAIDSLASPGGRYLHEKK